MTHLMMSYIPRNLIVTDKEVNGFQNQKGIFCKINSLTCSSLASDKTNMIKESQIVILALYAVIQ